MSKGFSFTVTESQTQTVDLCSFASQNPLKLPAMIYYITLGTSEYLILREQAI